MSERFLLPCGLLARAHSDACAAAPGDCVRVARPSRSTLELLRLGQIGELQGYSAGAGFAIVLFPDVKTPMLLMPECLQPMNQGTKP